MADKSANLMDIERLTSTVTDFCAWIESLPARETRAQEWGPREVLAHLVYWHEHYVAQSRTFLARKPLTPPGGRFVDLNAQAVAEFQTTPIPILTKRFQFANRRLCALARGKRSQAVAFSIKEGSKCWRLADLLPAVEAHIRNHLRTLKKNSSSDR